MGNVRLPATSMTLNPHPPLQNPILEKDDPANEFAMQGNRAQQKRERNAKDAGKVAKSQTKAVRIPPDSCDVDRIMG